MTNLLQAEFVKHVFANMTLHVCVVLRKTVKIVRTNFFSISLIFKCDESLKKRNTKAHVPQLRQVRDHFSGALINVYHLSVQVLCVYLLTKGRLQLFSSESGGC